MRSTRVAGAPIILAVLLTSSFVAADPPGREFTCTAVVDTTEGTRRMPMTLVANRFTSVEEAKQLAGLLEKGGQGTLLAALRGRSDGQLELGALSSPIALVVAEETRDGYRFIFLTARKIQFDETQLDKASVDYPFGIAEFEVDGFSGRGEGSLHVEAALDIDSSGHIEIDDYDGQDGYFEDLKRVR
jgi:hypothetical protein